VWSLAYTAQEAVALRDVAARLPEMERPAVLQGTVIELPELMAARGDADVRFDAILGRSVLTPPRAVSSAPDRPASAAVLAGLLRPTGVLSLVEPLPRASQRLYALVDLGILPSSLAARLRDAEEAIYASPDDPLMDWDGDDLRTVLEAAGLSNVTIQIEDGSSEVRVTPAMLTRWFTPAPPDGRPGYAQRLAAFLSLDELAQVQALYEGALIGKIVPWRAVTAFVVALAPG
jgi:putative ATPase